MGKRTRIAPPLPVVLIALAIGILALFNIKTITRVIGPSFQGWLKSTSEDISEAGRKPPK